MNTRQALEIFFTEGPVNPAIPDRNSTHLANKLLISNLKAKDYRELVDCWLLRKTEGKEKLRLKINEIVTEYGL